MYPPTIISISGPNGIGKTSLADALEKAFTARGYRAAVYAFSSPLKAKSIQDPRCTWSPNLVFTSGTSKPDDLRTYLSTISAEYQAKLGQNVWVDYVDTQCIIDAMRGVQVAIISDVRYPHEMEWLASLTNKDNRVSRVHIRLYPANGDGEKKDADASAEDIAFVLDHDDKDCPKPDEMAVYCVDIILEKGMSEEN